MPSTSPLVLPVVTIQPDFLTTIDEVYSGLVPSEKFWISCYKTSEPSIHAKVQASLDDVHRDLVKFEPLEGDVEIKRLGGGVSCSFLEFILI